MGAGTLLIRADARAAIGTGHVMRCLALAQAWQDSGGQCVFAMAESTPPVECRLGGEGMEVVALKAEVGSLEDAMQTAELSAKKSAVWIVADGYRFGSEYQRAIKESGFKLLFVDDNVHAASYCADLVLNQNIHARASLYDKRQPATRLLMGPRYAMLRREFRPLRDWRREVPACARKIIITMGGSDPGNLTKKAAEAIEKLADSLLETVILVGGSNPRSGAVGNSTGSDGKESIRFIVDATNVAELMAWADVAVAGAGTTFWEMCFLGLPSILLVLADNQQAVAEAADRMGIARTLGKGADVTASEIAGSLRELLASRETRANQSTRGRKLVDGRGAERVAAFLSDLQLRRTTESDCELFWQFANEPGARAASFRDKCISWESHQDWFQKKMADPQAMLFTATNATGVPIGEVRFQIEGRRSVLSISLGEQFRGQRHGQNILTVAIEELFRNSDAEFIDAYVKPSNEVSLKLFSGAGFLRLPPSPIEGQEAVHFVLEKNVVD
ncbi:MAG: UDP-2,4-diacetamido-2,4,6-trideoxy-beta-L-altropyranose hydrolase [Candidatus Sulfotelmatobacter sp.]